MIKAIIRFSAHNKYLVIAATLVALAGAWWTMKNISLDALPDMSDTQVIVYSKWDRSPDIIEDQVTYPITTALLGAPKVKAIRGFSDFGFSYVYVIFEDGTDIYWARTRVLEYLSKIQPQLPQGVQTELGPDATSVGWIFQYALVDRSGRHSSDELRSYQDWFLRYAVQSVPGVSEVATVGGQVRQYQVTVNPNALVAYKLTGPRLLKKAISPNWSTAPTENTEAYRAGGLSSVPQAGPSFPADAATKIPAARSASTAGLSDPASQPSIVGQPQELLSTYAARVGSPSLNGSPCCGNGASMNCMQFR